MLGGSLALASGLQRRYGWGIVALAGAAAALPDLDGLSIAFGSQAYANAHRVWGHNLLVAGGMGAAAGACEFKFGVFQRLCRSAVFQKNAGAELEPPPGNAPRALACDLRSYRCFGGIQPPCSRPCLFLRQRTSVAASAVVAIFSPELGDPHPSVGRPRCDAPFYRRNVRLVPMAVSSDRDCLVDADAGCGVCWG
jgi:hypothetical protein